MPGQLPRLFHLGIALPREQASAYTGDELAEWISGRLTELAPVYRFLAWSRDNDFVSMRQVLDKERRSSASAVCRRAIACAWCAACWLAKTVSCRKSTPRDI